MKQHTLAVTAVVLGLFASTASAAFHVMQIEQVIGGVDGNSSAQAIQLRMRAGGQNLVANAQLWAWDAAGANRVLLLDIASNVSNSASGAHILLATSQFTSTMIAGGSASFSPDFTLANTIPASYLAAGRLTFEDDAGSVPTPGTIYWSLSWGGAGYTGPTTGDNTNDADGNFGPSFASGLPTSTRQGVIFNGNAAAASTSNSVNYTLSTNPATVTKNNGTGFTVVPEPGSVMFLGSGAIALGAFAFARRRR